MGIKWITNAFSLNMLADLDCTLHVEKCALSRAHEILRGRAVPSAVGHADTAAVMQTTLGTPVPMNRATVSLNAGDTILVGQYSGPRLPEGATELPAGAAIQWALVTVRPPKPTKWVPIRL